MNAKDFDEIVGARLNWCMKTLCAKGDEYAREGDRLWNFKVAARKLNCHPAEALAGMMVKHTVSVDDIIDGLANGFVPPRELVAEKIGDSINYLLLLEGLIEEERMATSIRYKGEPLSGGHVVCSGCGLKCSIGSEQEQSVNLTGWCTICRADKERETYTVPPPQDGDDDPAVVHIVPDKTSRSTLPSGCLGRLCGRGDDVDARDEMYKRKDAGLMKKAQDRLIAAREQARSIVDDEWRPCPND